MINDPNPYQAPVANPTPVSVIEESGPQGFPGPILLAWIGVVLATGIVASFFITQTGVLAMICTLMIPPLRIAWVVYSRIQQRRHSAHWRSGARTFLFTMWVINITLLFVDAALILLVAVCFVALSNANN